MPNISAHRRGDRSGDGPDLQVVATRSVIMEPEVAPSSASLVENGDPESVPPLMEGPSGVLQPWKGIALVRKDVAFRRSFILYCDTQELVFMVVDVDPAPREHACHISDLRYCATNAHREDRLGLRTPTRGDWAKDRSASIFGKNLKRRLA